MHPVYHAKITVSTKNFPRLRIPTITTGDSDGSRPPVPIDRDAPRANRGGLYSDVDESSALLFGGGRLHSPTSGRGCASRYFRNSPSCQYFRLAMRRATGNPEPGFNTTSIPA